MFRHNVSVAMALEQLDLQEFDCQPVQQNGGDFACGAYQNTKLPSKSRIDKQMHGLESSVCYSDRSDGKNVEHTKLPSTFRPGRYDVICGRGKIVSNFPGNRRYKDLIQASLGQYIISSTKVEKTLLVTSIIKLIEQSSPEGGFIKRINGAWYKVSSSYAREKCGQRYDIKEMFNFL